MAHAAGRMRALFVTILVLTTSPAAAQWPATEFIHVEVLEPAVAEPNHGARQAAIGPFLEEFDRIEARATVVGVAGDSTELGCHPIAADLEGRIAVVRRGGCTFPTKILNAQAAGAVAVLVYNDVEPDTPEDTVFVLIGGDSTGVVIPSAFARAATGALLRSLDNPLLRYWGTGRCFDYGGTMDPTAPERYLPLAPGNAWEYLFESDFGNPEFRQRFDVQGDTVVAGQSYFVMRDARYGLESPEQPSAVVSTLVRFDSVRAHLVALGAGGEEVPHLLAACPLDAMDGTIENNCAGSYWSWEVSVTGGLRRYETCYVGIADVGGEQLTYAADRGLVERVGWSPFTPGSDRYRLEYSRVGGVETGAPVVWPVASGDRPTAARGAMRVTPDPARAAVAVTFTLERPGAIALELVDILGRRVATHDLGPRPAGAGVEAFDVSSLAAGRYIVRLIGDGELRLTVPLTVVR